MGRKRALTLRRLRRDESQPDRWLWLATLATEEGDVHAIVRGGYGKAATMGLVVENATRINWGSAMPAEATTAEVEE